MRTDSRHPAWPPLRAAEWLIVTLCGLSLAAGCDKPFEPYRDNADAPFTMFGFLNPVADTQWIRVMPVRQNILVDPAPIDGVVTLERLDDGKTVTLKDSLFRNEDQRLGGEGFIHNFWTTEPLEQGASYRLRAVRSDGASTSALVEIPVQPAVYLRYAEDRVHLTLSQVNRVRMERGDYLYVDVEYAVWDSTTHLPGEPVLRREPRENSPDPRLQQLWILPDTLKYPRTLPYRGLELRRLQLNLAVSLPDWPYPPGLSDTQVALPGNVPTNVEDGFGFVGGVVAWTIPLQRCHQIEPRPNGENDCATRIDASTASVTGRIIRQAGSCRYAQAKLRLTERFAGGGAVILEWQAGWDGRYEFAGIEPGADLVLDFGPDLPPVHLPPLRARQRYTVPDVPLRIPCQSPFGEF